MNTAFAIVDHDSYVVACAWCGAVSDAAQSLWCDCLTKERSPLCNACGHCLCKLGAEQRRRFWQGAPSSLHVRRRNEMRQPGRMLEVAAKAPLVLLVDDDEEIRAIGSHVISRLGFRCTTATNGPEALAMMAGEDPTVVITDALMPKMDGRALCRFIKRSSSAKVVIMTSLYTAAHYKYEAYKHFGADAYLAKPIDFAALQATLQRLAPGIGAER